MPQKISPNRRRSIAVLSQGGGSSRGAQRRRAYSIVPGEKLSPAARSRFLVPRKSILKGNRNSRLSQDLSGQAVDSIDVTQSMDLTEIQPPMSRKSLGRRVSFASHAHVRLFEVQDPNNSGSANPSSSPSTQEEDAESDDENAHLFGDIPAQNPRRSSQRRRSSTAFSEFGEQSMDMDEGDSALAPQDFLNGDEEEFDDEDENDYGDDMDMTEAIPREFLRKRSLSLGGPSQPLAPRRRSSVAPLSTSSSSHSENQAYHSLSSQAPQQHHAQAQESLYPSLQLEDILNLPPDEHDSPHDSHQPNEDVTSSTMQFGTEGEDMTESSGGDNTQPMEFTIPVVRPPPPPSKEWLQLRAMTHAGSEPYEPPPHEPLDDPEANAIVSPEQDNANESPMDLTDALNRLQKARSSLVFPPSSDDDAEGDRDNQNTDANEFDDSFSSVEASFNDEFDGDRTINVTKLRQSLGAVSLRDESMDVTSVYGDDTPLQSGEGHSGPQEVPTSTKQSVQQPQNPSANIASAESHIPPPVFSLPRPTQVSSSSAPAAADDPARPPVFSLPSTSSISTVFSAPTRNPQTQIPPKSPSRAVPTVPRPFTFSLDARLGSPSKGKEKEKAPAPPSPSKLPVFRGTAAFAPHTTPKSPRKRPNPTADGAGDDMDLPSPAKKQAVGKLSPSKKAVFERAPAPVQASTSNRRTSAVRRPSGYFAQRKSLGGGTLTTAASLPSLGGSDRRTAPALRPRASMGAVPSEDSQSLYPDLSHIEEPVPSPTRAPAELYPDVSHIVETPPTLAGPLREQSVTVPPRSTTPPHDKGSTLSEKEVFDQNVVVLNPATESSSSTSVKAAQRAASPISKGKESSPVPSSTQAPPRLVPPSPVHEKAPVTAPAPKRVSPSQTSSQVPSTNTVQTAPNESVEHDDEDDMEFTEQWREDLDQPDEMYDGEEPTISVEQFFQMTGIRFMDELTAPRRSTIHPGQLRPQNRRRSLTSSHSEEAAPVPLSEFMTAMAVEAPQLELYSVLANELTGWIEESKKICKQAEEDAIKVTPALFREFADADESEKSDLVHQLKLIKAHNIGMAKSQWYDWKSQWVGQLQNSAAEAFTNLEHDAKVLENIISQAQDMLPALRAEYEQAARELEQEEADVAELQNSDKDYLNELKVSIAEQDLEIQAFKANVSEAEAKLKRLDEKLTEIDAQKLENTTAIAQAEHMIHVRTESTSSEVLRLKEELEALQDLHLWRTTKISPNLMEFIYASRFVVSVPCVKLRPVLSQLRIERVKGARLRERDPYPDLTRLMLEGAKHVVSSIPGEIDIRKIIQRLSDFWSSCACIRSQLTFLAIKYPLSAQLLPADKSDPSFQITATVLFPAAKSKAYISFNLDLETYSRWPMSIGSLKADVEVAYGHIQRKQILDAVLTRLSQATPSENHGCLLDACIEATEQFAQT